MIYQYAKKIHFIKPDDILCSIEKRECYDENKLRALAQSISVNGILEPLTVRALKNGKYEVVCGKRRLAAAKIIGLRRVPCMIRKLDEKTGAIISISENIYRENPDFIEEAKQIESLINQYDMDIFTVSENLGISRSALISKLTLLKLNGEIRERIVRNNLSNRHAKIILTVPEDKRNEALDEILEITDDTKKIQQICEKYVYKESGIDYEQEKPESVPILKSSIGDMRLVSNSMTKLLKTLKGSGIDAYQQRTENDKYIEYKIRIRKTLPENARQLKLV